MGTYRLSVNRTFLVKRLDVTEFFHIKLAIHTAGTHNSSLDSTIAIISPKFMYNNINGDAVVQFNIVGIVLTQKKE